MLKHEIYLFALLLALLLLLSEVTLQLVSRPIVLRSVSKFVKKCSKCQLKWLQKISCNGPVTLHTCILLNIETEDKSWDTSEIFFPHF